MFTSTMTYEEILHETRLDYYELKPRMEAAFVHFRRKYSFRTFGQPNMLGSISEKITHKTKRHNVWTQEMHINCFYENKAHGGSVVYTPVPRSNGMSEYLFLWNHGAFIPELLSTHFIQRYKERYLEPNNINLRGLTPGLYFQKTNTDLRRTYFVPDNWTEEDLKNKLIWICNQGLFITVNHGGLRVYITFLDQKNLTRYKALVYEEEAQRRLFDNIPKECNSNFQIIESALNMLTLFDAPNSREIHKRFLKRICEKEGEERDKFIRETMEVWDRLEKTTRHICERVQTYFNKCQTQKELNFEIPGLKEYVEKQKRLLKDQNLLGK